jgi:pimeloyl-ACP methyl ester carboxylesterase
VTAGTTVTVDGHRLAYRQFGSGDRVVVLSHAFLTSHYLEHAWAKELAERFPGDLPGPARHHRR